MGGGRGGFGNKSLVLGPPKSPSAAGGAAAAGAAAGGTSPPTDAYANGSGGHGQQQRAKSPVGAGGGVGLPPQHRALVRDPVTGKMTVPTKNKVWVNPNLLLADNKAES